MNREIKFRAWDGILLTYSDTVNPILINQVDKLSYFFRLCGNDDKLMQCTGIKDKGHHEIYEGDILKHNANQYTVKYSENKRVLVLVEKFINPKSNSTNWRDLEWCHNVRKYIEIIGNIYQNPDLL